MTAAVGGTDGGNGKAGRGEGHRTAGFALLRILPCLLVLLISTGAHGGEEEKAWRLAVHPFISATELMERFQPLADYLSEATGERFVIEVSSSYEAHIHSVAEGLVDLAYMGPASFARLWREAGPHDVLAREAILGRETFHGVLLARDDSDAYGVDDVSGRTVGFVNDSSTMGYWMPRRLLAEYGIELDDLAGHRFLGNHHNVVAAVLLGDVEVGAVREEVYREYAGRGLRVLGRTADVPHHPLVARRGLTPERVARWRAALLELAAHPDGPAVLSAMGEDVSGLVPAAIDDYRPLRESLEAEE